VFVSVCVSGWGKGLAGGGVFRIGVGGVQEMKSIKDAKSLIVSCTATPGS